MMALMLDPDAIYRDGQLSSARSTLMCAIPRGPPPPSTRPIDVPVTVARPAGVVEDAVSDVVVVVEGECGEPARYLTWDDTPSRSRTSRSVERPADRDLPMPSAVPSACTAPPAIAHDEQDIDLADHLRQWVSLPTTIIRARSAAEAAAVP